MQIGRLSTQTRKALMALRDRSVLYEPGRGGGGGGTIYQHPFRIVATTVDDDPAIMVGDGAFSVVRWFTDNSTIYSNSEEYAVQINSMPLGYGEFSGKLTLAADTDYGVFIVAETSLGSRVPFANGTGFPVSMAVSDPIVIVSSTLTSATDLGALTSAGTYEGYAGWYLGKAEVDADGVVSVTQYRKSDICVTEPVWVSPTIVSGDAGNSITTGTDGGAYYEEPPGE
jgi:hypothetical protein